MTMSLSPPSSTTITEKHGQLFHEFVAELSHQEHVHLAQHIHVFRLDLMPWQASPIWYKYHTACCDKSNIWFLLEYVKGKDCPWQLTIELYNVGGKTIELFLQMLKRYSASGK